LFAERAHRVRYDFSLADEEQNVLRICQAVEGLPLAIELAATWLRRLTCGQVADEIEYGLDLLSSDEQGISERHRTMRVVFDHSWGQLTLSEQNVLANLSVFRGGFLREAAEEIAGATLPILSSFVDQSLIRMTATGRYAIHELQRQYAAERLSECPEYQDRVLDQHSKHYLGFVSIPIVRLVGEGNRPLLTSIEAELDNILAAWYWAVDHRKIPILHRAMKGLCWFLWLSTYHHEGGRAFRHAVDTLCCEEASKEERIAFAYALTWYGATNIWFGHAQEANRRIQDSVAILREIPSGRPELGAALGYLGWSTYDRSEIVEAATLFRESAEICKETEQFVLLAWIYCMLGASARRLSAYQEQEKRYLQALQFGREIGDQRTVSNSLQALGRLATQRGEYAEANRYLNESLSVARRHNISAFVYNSLVGLGQLSGVTGDYETASDYLQQSLGVARLWGDSPEISHSLITQAQVRTGQRMYEEAAGLFQEASELQAGIFVIELQLELLCGLGNLALNSGSYAQAQLHYSECLTLSQRPGDRLSETWASIGLALVAIGQNESEQATHHLIEALDTGLSIGVAPVLLDAICASAEMFSSQGDCAYAAQLAMLVNHHRASTAETKQRAAHLLEHLVPKPVMDNAIAGKQGDTLVDIESVATRLIEELQRLQANITNANMAEQPLIEPLSDRELEVLRMVADGKSNREIGRELYLALGTVKSHLHHIFQKLDVRSRTQAVARAIEIHLL
jgi:DNA-binding CsgD family transcriptional regulator/tetratricopeptide (TPR) repeat protein